MALPNWDDVRKSLAEAITAAFPLQIRKAAGQRIAGIGLHIDAFYGSAGLYLLPEGAALTLPPDTVDDIGGWPISTDWVLSVDHAVAFAHHWRPWDKWIYNNLDESTDAEKEQIFRGLHRVACEAMHQVEMAGLFDFIPKTEGFKIIIAEHDEPVELCVERYGLFLRTGAIRVFGD